MIYECPNCHVPQAAGRTSCHHCGAEFDGPVPPDALVPEAVAAATSAVSPPEDARPQPPVVQDVPPSPQENRLPEPPPYQPPPAYQPPPSYPQTAYAPPPPASGFNLPKALLIAIPIVLVLVLGAVFFANSLNQGSETVAPPSVTPTAMPEPRLSTPVPVPHGSPLVLSGSTGAAGSTENNPNTSWLVGRWQNKASDFYQFNENGTGYRGSSSGRQAKGSFLWVLVQKQIVLYADAEKPEKLAFSQGSDDKTMYLRGTDGRYVQYARAKTSS